MFLILTLANPICPLFHLINVNSNWIDPQKISQGKIKVPPTQLPPQIFNIYYTSLPLFMKVCVFQMQFNLNKIFASNLCAEMRLNELKWA